VSLRPERRHRLGLEQLETRDCPSTLQLVANGVWTDPSIWWNAATRQHQAPTSSDDVDLTGAFNVQYNGSGGGAAPNIVGGGPAANTVTLDALFTGTLTVNSVFQVANGLEEDSGAIAQPGGVGVSDVQVNNGFFTWAGGVLNSSPVQGLLKLVNGGNATIKGTNLSTDDGVAIWGTWQVHMQFTGALTFEQNSGMTLYGGVCSLEKANQKIATTGTGVIDNEGGSFVCNPAGGTGTISCDLPYINNNSYAALTVSAGNLVFTNAGPAGVSVLQNTGGILLKNATELTVNKGLTMDGGLLQTVGQAAIGVGAVTINGGTVNPAGTAFGNTYGSLTCDGAVVMNGGTYLVEVDMTDPSKYDFWKAASFKIGGTATLTVNSLNVPQQLKPPYSYAILQTGKANAINGDFTTFTDNLAIPGTGKNFSHGIDPKIGDYNVFLPK
jgi:hypothetical protein